MSKTAVTEAKNGNATYLTTAEACKRLDMTSRNFRLLRRRLGPIEGQTIVAGSLLFPVESLDAWYARYEGGNAPEDDEPTVEETAAASLREFADGVRLMLNVALEAIKFTLSADQALVKLSFEQADNSGKALNHSQQHALQQQKHSLEAVSLIKDMIIETGKLEADRIKADADQTVRVERTKLAAAGIRQLAPVAKAGLARWAGMPGIARDAQADTVLEVVRSLSAKPEKLIRLQEILSDDQREAVASLLGFAEGREKLDQALRTIKRDMTEARSQALMQVLDDKELTAIASLFDDVDDAPSGTRISAVAAPSAPTEEASSARSGTP